MELTSNLLQFLVTLLGFCLGAILYCQNRRQAYFLLACFYGCFALGSLYWTLYLLLFSETPRVFYVSCPARRNALSSAAPHGFPPSSAFR